MRRVIRLNVGDALTSLSLSLHVTDRPRTDNDTTAVCMRNVSLLCVIGFKYDVEYGMLFISVVMFWGM